MLKQRESSSSDLANSSTNKQTYLEQEIVTTVQYLSGYREEYDETTDNSEMSREASQILRIMTNPRHLNLHISPSRRPSTNSTGEQINHLVSNMFRITGSVAVVSSGQNNNNKTRNKR